MAKSLVGKTAIITGAANGIGLSVAKLFCEEGANVVLADNDETSLEEEVEYLKKNRKIKNLFANLTNHELNICKFKCYDKS